MNNFDERSSPSLNPAHRARKSSTILKDFWLINDSFTWYFRYIFLIFFCRYCIWFCPIYPQDKQEGGCFCVKIKNVRVWGPIHTYIRLSFSLSLSFPLSFLFAFYRCGSGLFWWLQLVTRGGDDGISAIVSLGRLSASFSVATFGVQPIAGSMAARVIRCMDGGLTVVFWNPMWSLRHSAMCCLVVLVFLAASAHHRSHCWMILGFGPNGLCGQRLLLVYWWPVVVAGCEVGGNRCRWLGFLVFRIRTFRLRFIVLFGLPYLSLGH